MEKNFGETILIVLKSFKKVFLQGFLFLLILSAMYFLLAGLTSVFPFLLPLWAVGFIILAVFSCGIFVVAENKILDVKESSVPAAFAQAWSRFFPMAALGIAFIAIAILCVVLRSLLIITLPLLFLASPIIIFLVPAVILREEGPVSAFSYSFNLVRDHYLLVFAHYLVMIALNILVSVLIYLLSTLIVSMVFSTTGALETQSLNAGKITGFAILFVLNTIPIMFSTVYNVVLLLNLEHRLDPQIREKALDYLEKVEKRTQKDLSAEPSNPGIMDQIPLKKDSNNPPQK
ncbi:hypothetical protein Dip510_000406 [Elusimicrobium posterum]|uniref:hypothetical protein n=1 Tax=Elusimicrobium posterum TaxID=3116653 RepID=UPI003C7449F7